MNRCLTLVALVAAGLLSACSTDQMATAKAAAIKGCDVDAVAQPVGAAVATAAGGATGAAVAAVDTAIVHPAVAAGCASLKKDAADSTAAAATK